MKSPSILRPKNNARLDRIGYQEIIVNRTFDQSKFKRERVTYMERRTMREPLDGLSPSGHAPLFYNKLRRIQRTFQGENP